MRPIKPDECEKVVVIPDEVIAAFNKTIAEHYKNGISTFRLSEVIDAILKEFALDPFTLYTSKDSLKSQWLDVEDIYRNTGWDVHFDGPGYCETYPATYSFRRK